MSKLTQEEKRIRLAQSQGWTCPRGWDGAWPERLDMRTVGNRHVMHGVPPGQTQTDYRHGCGPQDNLQPVPDYFGDIGTALGAVKRAVTELLEEDQVTLLGRRVAGRYALDTLSGSDEEVHYAFANMLASLTAADYAEALGQTLGLWKEGE